MRKYEYSVAANVIDTFTGLLSAALAVTGFTAAVKGAWAIAIAALALIFAMRYFVKKYCMKINGKALADRIRSDEVFAEEYFKENPQLKKWYCPKCRSVYTGGVCGFCGYKKENKGGK